MTTREALVLLLGSEAAGNFTTEDVGNLERGGYSSMASLRTASREGLTGCSLLPARIDAIMFTQSETAPNSGEP